MVERSFYHVAMSTNILTAEVPCSLMERLLLATEELIYTDGIHATGIDAIVRRSGVSRKTIYASFQSKNELVAAALAARDDRWMQWFSTKVEEAGSTPRERLLGMFHVLQIWFASEKFRGCAFLNAAAEITSSDDPIRQIARFHKERLLAYVQSLAEGCGTEKSRVLARQLLLLIDGAISVALVGSCPEVAMDARNAAEKLLDSYDVPN